MWGKVKEEKKEGGPKKIYIQNIWDRLKDRMHTGLWMPKDLRKATDLEEFKYKD